MNRNLLALSILVALLFIGCSKKAIYEPEGIDGRLSYSDRTPAPMNSSRPGMGASLTDGSLLLKSADHETLDLQAGFKLVGLNGPWRLVANDEGALEVIHTSKERRYRLQFDQPVLVAATDGEVVATLSRDNSLRLHNLSTDKTGLLIRERHSSAVAAPVATPLMGADQVIFATLDGKVVIIDRRRNAVVLERVVGTEGHFGNVRFLLSHQGRIIAATNDRVISLAQDGSIQSLSAQVRSLNLLPSGLYLFTTEGDVIALSEALERRNEVRLPFARIIDAYEREQKLYLIEQSGYLIKSDLDFSNRRVYELPDRLSAPFLATQQHLYLHRKGVRWP